MARFTEAFIRVHAGAPASPPRSIAHTPVVCLTEQDNRGEGPGYKTMQLLKALKRQLGLKRKKAKVPAIVPKVQVPAKPPPAAPPPSKPVSEAATAPIFKTPRELETTGKASRILIACMPKSGSTFLNKTISNLPGMRYEGLVPGRGRREQELCLHHLYLAEHKTRQRQAKARGPLGYVTQRHIRYSDPTAKLLDDFGIRPVVLVRNIFDVVPSLRDHLRSNAVFMPMAYFDESMRGWDDDRMHHFIADMVMPWYINFHVSWCGCPSKLLITYEGMTASKQETVKRVLDFAGVDAGMDQIAAAITAAESGGTRFNKGVTGRGGELSTEVKNKIRRQAAYYPDVDFSVIGL